VICGTCGKTNAEHLVFCEDCGARLAKAAPPPAAPAMQAGSGTVALRPSAPDITFAPPRPGSDACGYCGAHNAPGMRFCVTCGRGLEAKPAPVQPAPVQPAPVQPAPAPPPEPKTAAAQLAQVPIAPAPVVDLGARPAPVEASKTCWRCRGTAPATSQFCRFCGAPLNEPAAPQRTPSPAQVAPTPAPGPVAAVPAPVPAPGVAPTPHKRLDVTLVSGPPAFEAPPPTSPDALAPPAMTALPAGPPSEEPTVTVPLALFSIVSIAQDGGEGARFPITTQLDIGRNEGDVQVPEDGYLAPRHARITREGDALTIRDLGTPNGVYLRIRKEAEVPLQDQDLILVGQQVLRFEVVKGSDEGFGAATQHGTLLFGTPAVPVYARLLQRSTEGVTRDIFHIRDDETVLGRESGDIVFTKDAFLSRRHAIVHKRGDAFFLADLGSSNGTFHRIRGQVALKQGDELRVGQQLYRVDGRAGKAPETSGE
jgi:pSer/pThr/pTyr-binding forkhead associated (FHA) protein